MEKIIVGMSGGVDSAVASSILIEKGFDVEGLFMKNWEDNSEFCSAEQDYKDALQVCDKLNIPLRSVNFAKQYWERVFKEFLSEHKNGRTPNPDILCNTEIKFKEFYKYAIDLGASRIATGHYAQNQVINGEAKLLKGIDSNKDQSYFLYGLKQKQIINALFPIGNLKKNDVRSHAIKLGFSNANKKDSVGICFIGERNMAQFLSKYFPENPGHIVTENGSTLGEHKGLMYFTIGQRKGLGIGGKSSGEEKPWYVAKKDIENNELIVVQGRNHPTLYHKKVTASKLHWISEIKPIINEKLNAKTRYRSEDKPCRVESIDHDKISIEFQEPRFAITPGQSIVFYKKNICLGGGLIDSYKN